MYPDKYDIIPIHASDINSYMRCRRYWNWTSPSRQNLRRRVDIHGVNTNLWFGTGIHYALEMYYHPVLKRDPVEAFRTWYTYQWEGGRVTKDWLDLIADNKPTAIAMTSGESLYQVRGLRDILPDADHEEFAGFLDLGIGMLTFFKDYAERNDNFDVVAAESSFSIPLGFEAIDYREQSPNFGKLLEVHARGKRDAILRYHDTGKFGVTDYKTAGVFDESIDSKLETDPQCSTYIWATQQEDAEWSDVDNVLYQVLRKVYPSPPTVLTSGLPSVARSTESTTAALFEQYIRERDLLAWFEGNQKAQAYYTWLLELGDANFIQRKYAYRNPAEVKATGEHIKMVAREMVDINTQIYPRYTGDYNCTRCAFRVPCISMQDGSDYQAIIDDGYERNKDR